MQTLHGVVVGVSRLFCAAVELLLLNRFNFAGCFQVERLDVPGGKGFNLGWGGHRMGNICQACGQKHNESGNAEMVMKEPALRRRSKLFRHLWPQSRLRGSHLL